MLFSFYVQLVASCLVSLCNPLPRWSGRSEGHRSMIHVSMKARHGPARGGGWLPRRWAGPAITRVAAGTMLAALLVAAAAPARAHAAQGRSPAPKPTPRAFFGLGPATKGKIDGRSYFNWSATPAGHLSDQVAVVNFGTKPVTVRIFVTNAVNGTQGTTGFAPRGQAKGGPFDWIT